MTRSRQPESQTSDTTTPLTVHISADFSVSAEPITFVKRRGSFVPQSHVVLRTGETVHRLPGAFFVTGRPGDPSSVELMVEQSQMPILNSIIPPAFTSRIKISKIDGSSIAHAIQRGERSSAWHPEVLHADLPYEQEIVRTRPTLVVEFNPFNRSGHVRQLAHCLMTDQPFPSIRVNWIGDVNGLKSVGVLHTVDSAIDTIATMDGSSYSGHPIDWSRASQLTGASEEWLRSQGTREESSRLGLRKILLVDELISVEAGVLGIQCKAPELSVMRDKLGTEVAIYVRDSASAGRLVGSPGSVGLIYGTTGSTPADAVIGQTL